MPEKCPRCDGPRGDSSVGLCGNCCQDLVDEANADYAAEHQLPPEQCGETDMF